MKRLKNSEIENILVVSLSNIGDVILTLPVIDTLKANFPKARINVVVGPKAAELLSDDPRVNVIIYDKRIPFKSKLGFFIYLRKQKFDLIVDLRYSALTLFLRGTFKTSPFVKTPKTVEHMKHRHLYKLKSTYPAINKFYTLSEININDSDRNKIDRILSENKLSSETNIVIVGPGAASHWKRYHERGFARTCDYLIENYSVKIVMVGDKNDSEIAQKVSSLMNNESVNLCGQTNLKQLAYLIKKTKLVISNDSAVMHMASYLDVPVLAMFGPTNPNKYGPWNSRSFVVKKELNCSPCEESSCRYNHECMALLKEDLVIKQAKKFFESDQKLATSAFPVYKRILIIRTDRIGDVLLSTPAIKAVKDFYPNSFLAVMVRPYAKEIIEGNPYVDELIIYDKYGEQNNILSSIKFAMNLKKKKFDLAIVLHPTNRVNLITFFAGIPERIGYNRKMGFLLTKKMEDKKHLGEKHEMEYSFDIIRFLGIEPKDKKLLMPIKQPSENWADGILKKNRVSSNDKIAAIHPGASCPSKIWPQKFFSDLANKLANDYGYKIVIIAGPNDKEVARKVIMGIDYPVIDLSGQTTISELASILKRCKLFISNDSGPVHISTAVDTPTISIFGRSQKGLSPLRWGPLGERDKFLHKDVGCIECFAHNCKKEFKCLTSIGVEDVLEAVDEVSKL